MLLTIKPTNNNNYYIYVVKSQNNTILYINADKLPNIVSFKQLIPDPRFNTSELYNVEILTSHANYFNAMDTVNKLIKDLCGDRIPTFNISQHYTRNASILCHNTGVVYRNANEACQALNIHPPRMSNHLKKKIGHKSIHGQTFSYIERE